jgi:putative acetyltransferase
MTASPSDRKVQPAPPESTNAVEFGPMQSVDDALAFRLLNEEWITRWFTLEQKDRETLGDPQGSIVERGGSVLMARVNGIPVGCVALIPMEDRTFELSKMAVQPGLRGLGVGRRLILHAIEQARSMGAQRLFLGSSTKLVNAVHLYESVGFRHVPAESLPEMKYKRADVFMDLPL